MNLERYWAKPDKTIQQHINDLLTHLETLKQWDILTQMIYTNW